MVDLLWGLDKTGGPCDTTNIIHQHIMCLRKDGYEIECWRSVGMRTVKVGNIQTSKK